MSLQDQIQTANPDTIKKLQGFKGLFEYNADPAHRHDIQLAFHRSSKFIRLFLGGNRSGKTTAGVVEVIWLTLGIHPWHQKWEPPINARIVSMDYKTQQRVIMPKIEEFLPRWFYRFDREGQILYLKNGSTIELMSYESDPSKFGGAARHVVQLDEEPPSYSIYTQNLMRLADYDGFMLITMTPIELQMTWTYEELVNVEDDRKEDIEIFQCGVYANPFLSGIALKRIEKQVRDDQKQAILYGEFFPQSARIYPMYDENDHIIDDIKVEDEWMWVLAIDPHLREAHHCLFAGIDKEHRIFIFKEMSERTLIPTFAEMILDYCKSMDKEPAVTLIDSFARTPDVITGIDTQKAFGMAGLGTVLAHKDVDAGIGRVRDCLAASKLEKAGIMEFKEAQPLYIFRSCAGLRREFRNYIWEDYKLNTQDKHNPKQTPRKKNDHYLDCLRYIINSYPRYQSYTQSQTIPKRKAGLVRL